MLGPTVAVALVPVAVAAWGQNPFGPAKLLATFVAATLACAALATRPGMRRRLADVTRRPLGLALAAALGVVLLSLATAIDAGLALKGVYPGYVGILALAAWSAIGAASAGAAPGEVRVVAGRGAALAVLPIAGVAIAAMAGIDMLGVATARIGSLLGNASNLGVWLAAATPLLADRSMTERGRWRWLAWLALVAGAVASALSGSRGGWIALSAGLAVWLMLPLFSKASARPQLARRALVVLVVLACVGVTVAFTPAVAERATGGGVAAETTTGRLAVWRATLPLVADRPVLGWGVAAYGRTFGRYASEATVDASGRTELLDDPHNLVLSIAASTGLVGVLAWLAVAAAAVASVFALLRDRGLAADSGSPGRSDGGLDPGTCGHTAAVAGGLAGLVVGVQFHFVTLETGALGAVLIGALLGLQATNAPGASEVIEAPRKPRGGRWIASGAAIVFASLGIVAAALVGADAHVRAGFDAASAGAWERAESTFVRARSLAPWEPAFVWAEGRAATAAVQNAADGRALAQGRNALAEAVERMPGDARPLRDIGDLEVTAALAGLGQDGWGRAESAYNDALAYAPVDPKAWLGRGVARMMLGDMIGAESDMLRAVEIAPSFAVAWANLAELYTAEGRTSEATAARARAAVAESAQ